jgi:hypothetical protein
VYLVCRTVTLRDRILLYSLDCEVGCLGAAADSRLTVSRFRFREPRREVDDHHVGQETVCRRPALKQSQRYSCTEHVGGLAIGRTFYCFFAAHNIGDAVDSLCVLVLMCPHLGSLGRRCFSFERSLLRNAIWRLQGVVRMQKGENSSEDLFTMLANLPEQDAAHLPGNLFISSELPPAHSIKAPLLCFSCGVPMPHSRVLINRSTCRTAEVLLSRVTRRL